MRMPSKPIAPRMISAMTVGETVTQPPECPLFTQSDIRRAAVYDTLRTLATARLLSEAALVSAPQRTS